MKTMNKLFLGLGFCAGLVSCSDFDEVNTNPTAAGEEYVKPQYALNNSIGQAQMNPGTAERIVVYNWASAARICGEMSFLNVAAIVMITHLLIIILISVPVLKMLRWLLQQ